MLYTLAIVICATASVAAESDRSSYSDCSLYFPTGPTYATAAECQGAINGAAEKCGPDGGYRAFIFCVEGGR